MELPKFLLGDNTDCADAIFVIHTEFPRFLINLVDDEIEWWEDFDGEDQEELEEMAVEPVPFQRVALWMGVFIILCASAMKHLHT